MYDNVLSGTTGVLTFLVIKGGKCRMKIREYVSVI